MCKNKGNKMDKHKGEIIEYDITELSKLKTEIFNDYGERKYKIISIVPRKETIKGFSSEGFNSYREYYLVYVKLGSTLKEAEEKKIAKKNKKKELLNLVNSIYNFVLPEEKKKEIAFLEDKKKKAEKLKEAEEFRRRNSPTIEELKEDLQKAKDNAREVTESLRYLRP